MKTLFVVATLVMCFLLCGFQGKTSSGQRKPAPQGAKEQKADSGKVPHGAASPGEPATDATDKVAPTAPRQSDKVEVTALPPEIAIKQIRDSIDCTILYCTIVLTIVGVVGMGVGVWTLLAIKDQAETLHQHSEELRKLAEAARDNAAAAKENAEAARNSVTVMKEQSDLMVEKERAKLRIELDEFRPIKDEHEIYWVKGHVSIYGSTEAFIERTEIYASIGAAGIFNPLPEWLWGMHLPAVIRSNVEPILFSVMVMATDGPATDAELLPVREAKEFIYLMAKTEFADAFGRRWVVQLRRRFGFVWSDVGGSWEDSGPAGDNGERRNEAEQFPKPNVGHYLHQRRVAFPPNLRHNKSLS